MATAHLRGTERLEYGAGPTVHLLAVPLQELEPVDARARYEWWSADLTARETVVLGAAGVRELLATIRCDNQPAELKALLRAGLEQDATLTYRRSAGGTAYPVKLVAVVGAQDVTLKRDRDRGHMREYEVRIHLRRVDGGMLDGLL